MFRKSARNRFLDVFLLQNIFSLYLDNIKALICSSMPKNV